MSTSRRSRPSCSSPPRPLASFTDRIRTLLWVAATNFVVPVLFSLAQIIVVFRGVDVLVINDIVLVNTSIAVIGVVFATVWADTAHWTQEHSHTSLGNPEPSRLVFQNSGGSSVDREPDSERREDVEYGAVLARLSPIKDE